MRVRHLAFGLGLGGTERAAQNVAIETQRMGHASDVVVLTDGPRRAILEASGIDVIHADSFNLALQPVDVLVVHSHGLPPELVFKVLAASGDPVVAEVNVFSAPTPWMSRVDVSFQLSPWAHWLFVQRGGDARRSSTLANPVDADAFVFSPAAANEFKDRHSLPRSARVIGRVGQPLVNKWSPVLIPALSEAISAFEDAHVLLIGAPDELAQQALKSIDPRRVTLVDAVSSDQELSGAYSTIDVFAHAARQGESFGYVLAEAALTGSPIVTLATPWADNSQGFVAGPDARVAITPRGFTEHLRASLAQPRSVSDREADCHGARQHVVDNFSSRFVTQTLLDTVTGVRPRVAPPSDQELSRSIYFGSDEFPGKDLLRRFPRNRMQAVLAKQESVRWLASQEWLSIKDRFR